MDVMTRTRWDLCAVALLLTVPLVGRAQNAGTDWPQFRGPNRDGSAAAFKEPQTWPTQLTKKWAINVGEGYSTPLIVGDRVYTFTRQGTNEVMQALDANTGKSLWQTRYAAPVKVNPAAEAHGPGPKSTPAFAGGRLYTLGMGGIVTAFDAGSGKQLWQKPATPKLPLYGTAASPLVDRGLVIVNVGGHDAGALTAFDANTGSVKWSWNGDGPSYASPIVADIAGVRQVIALTQDNVVGIAAADGRLLWRRSFKTEFTQNIITPVLIGDTVIIAGYQQPMPLLSVQRGRALLIHESRRGGASLSADGAKAPPGIAVEPVGEALAIDGDVKRRRRTITEPVASAAVAGLRYVSDAQPGIRRKHNARGMSFTGPDGNVIRRAAEIKRILALAVPPAWTDVWICPDPRGHIQATGRDAKHRKQYRYHREWRATRDETKFDRMQAFAAALPILRRRTSADLSRPGLPRNKVIATIVQLLEKSLIRIGNEEYARQNGSFGLTTLRNRHASTDPARRATRCASGSWS